MDFKDMFDYWLNDNYFDEKTKKELKSIIDNEVEIKERFYKDLEFGTGGLRGIIGAGTNRMNIYTVRKATQGLANYIVQQGGESKGVAIAYDSRIMSPEFADEAALCLNANGVETYIFEALRPTPELSFAVRELGCIAGIVITASHNPSEYNGYKVYWEDGAQITAPKDKEIIAEVKKVKDFCSVKTISKEQACELGLYKIIGKEIDDRYNEELHKLTINRKVIDDVSDSMTIVYTPLHGTGNVPVQRILNELGFKNVFVVSEQEEPDGKFSTVVSPNPEDAKAFTMALELAKKVGADIVLATDPDADRLGVYAKDLKSGEYKSFTGNMSGMVIADYMISQRKEKGTLPQNGALIKTIVTTNMANVLSNNYGIHLIEVLTGFKYIGEQIKFFEENDTFQYLFGLEESYGCLAGTYARDKDAVSAVMMLCEVAAYCKCNHMTLWDYMLKLYDQYGYFKEDLLSFTLKGIDGVERIHRIMQNFREKPLRTIGGLKVLRIRDYQKGQIKNQMSGEVKSTGLPVSNVLYFDLEEDAWCCVRPSGTEPKIKFYMGVKARNLQESNEKCELMKKEIESIVIDV
ncbi:phospho-sugar mutase [Robinsoniella sp. KNHs210]|uniref:phospho-sugar mutase n=1 Tax=Robinsoniella TaxID=588605 RepID=UPI0004898496|nr:phospho-sugar mutase [Robinsoniella sp. KNHs210]